MKRYPQFLLGALLVAAIALSGCGAAASPASAPVADSAAAPAAQAEEALNLPVEIDAAQLNEIRNRDDVYVLDVREDWEFQSGHVPEANLDSAGRAVQPVERSSHRQDGSGSLPQRQPQRPGDATAAPGRLRRSQHGGRDELLDQPGVGGRVISLSWLGQETGQSARPGREIGQNGWPSDRCSTGLVEIGQSADLRSLKTRRSTGHQNRGEAFVLNASPLFL